MALHDLTLTELAVELGTKRASSREIVDALLGRIAKADGKLHAFTEVYSKEARALADAADTARGTGFPLPPLHGLPIAYKDLCDIAGRIGTGGSQMLAKRVATETSNTVERLTAAGMVPLGKFHMVEFALGGWGTNPLMGAPWNPWDLEIQRVPGGSSSGTGVAVAARFAPAGIGSDTGGSVRIPSAFQRPGRTSRCVRTHRPVRHDAAQLDARLDRANGTLGGGLRATAERIGRSRSARSDNARSAARGFYPLDAGRLDRRHACGAAGPRPVSRFHAPRCRHRLAGGGEVFESLGAHVESVRLPDMYFELALPTGTLMASEAFALHRDHIEDMSQAIGPAVRNRALAARSFTPGAYADEIRRMGERRRAFASWFGAYDAILTPTVGVPAIPLSEVDEASPIPNHLTRPANYLGLCSLEMPSGFSAGLPIGVQLVGKPYAEGTVLRLGKAYQDATEFHRQAPDLSALGL